MLRGRKQQQGSMLLVVVTTIMVIALAVLVSMVGDLTAGIGRRFSATDETLSRVQVALVSFVSTYQRLPCPADPTGVNGPGWPDGVQPLALPASSTSTCAYPGGVVPWNALGLTKEQVTDVWGRLISYRVYDGQFGLTQDKGASAVNCDTENGSTPNVAPVATTGLCNNASGLHDTLRSEFITHATFGTKGLNVHDFGPTPTLANVPNVAYVLISHGPSGHGGYTASGVRVPMPVTDARDYANTQIAPAFFVRQAASAAGIGSGTAGHFDDSISYLKITDLLSLTKLDARDWPEEKMPSFDSVTTANLTSASTDPSSPHFMSTGQGDQAFVAVVGGTAIAGGIGSGSYSACLWWPRKLTLVSDTSRRALTTYIEFASVDNQNDAFPGFTLGYLAGTSSVSTGATGANGGSSIVVASASGISVGMSVIGVGIATGATVTSIAGTTIGVSPANTAIVSGTATFGAPTNITCGTSKSVTVTATGDAEQDELVVSNTDDIDVGMNVFGDGIPFGARVESILAAGVGGTIRLTEDTTADIAGSIDLSVSRQIRRDIGWAGGTLAGYANRFAIEFDAATDLVTFGPPAVASAFDPDTPNRRPHLAVDFGGVTHGADASSCTTTSPGSGCDSEMLDFPARTKSATGSTGQSVITITDVSGMYGIVHGMTVSGSSAIPSNTTVTALSGNLVTLSQALTGTVTSVTFNSRSSSSFMQNGLSVFHGMRTEIYPRDCAAAAATGASGASTVTVTDASQIQPSMAVYGSGIGVGAVVPTSPFTLNLSTGNTANLTGPITFTGSGSTIVINATGAIGQPRLTVSNVAGLVAGMSVSGSGIGAGATLSSVEVPLSATNSGTVASNIVFAGATAIQTSGTGLAGTTSVTVGSAAGIAAGMTAIGTGIATGAKVVSVSVGGASSVVVLSIAHTSAVSGSLKFFPEKAFLKGWTLSNAGCNLDPSLCTAMKNVNAKLSYPGSSGVTMNATGSAGSMDIVVQSATGIALGMAVSGTGIANGAYVTGITITSTIPSVITISLSQPNTAAVSSVATFDNRQILHTVSCIPAASVANAYDSLYFGLTTANRTSNAAETTNGTGLAGSNQVTVSDPSGIVLGMAVRGIGIANGATVTNIAGATLTLSAANTGVVSGSLSFAGAANMVFRALNVSTTVLP